MELVDPTFGFTEDKDASSIVFALEDVEEGAALVKLVYNLNDLLNAGVGCDAVATDLDMHWCLSAVVSGEFLHLLGPGGAPHERLAVGPNLTANAN